LSFLNPFLLPDSRPGDSLSASARSRCGYKMCVGACSYSAYGCATWLGGEYWCCHSSSVPWTAISARQQARVLSHLLGKHPS
jgi:hypothetical protein